MNFSLHLYSAISWAYHLVFPFVLDYLLPESRDCHISLCMSWSHLGRPWDGGGQWGLIPQKEQHLQRHSKRKHSCWWIRESVIVCLCVCIHMHFAVVIFEISAAFIRGCEKYFSLEPQNCILMLLISFHQQCRIILKRAKIELRKWLKYSCRNPKGTVKIQVKALEVKKEKRIF